MSSAIRSALQKLQQENQALINRLEFSEAARLRTNTQRSLKEEEEDCEGDDEELETSSIMSGKRGPPCFRSSESGKRHCRRPDSLKLTEAVSYIALSQNMHLFMICVLRMFPNVFS